MLVSNSVVNLMTFGEENWFFNGAIIFEKDDIMMSFKTFVDMDNQDEDFSDLYSSIILEASGSMRRFDPKKVGIDVKNPGMSKADADFFSDIRLMIQLEKIRYCLRKVCFKIIDNDELRLLVQSNIDFLDKVESQVMNMEPHKESIV